MANERDQIRVGYKSVKIDCHQAFNKDECMVLLDQENATMTTLDAGMIFNGGRYHSLVPIAQEVLDGGFKHYYAVAVVKKGSLPDVRTLFDLRYKKACFAGVETFAGWILPINTVNIFFLSYRSVKSYHWHISLNINFPCHSAFFFYLIDN